MRERDEVVVGSNGSEWEVAQLGTEIMVVDFSIYPWEVEFEKFTSEEGANEAFERIKSQIVKEGDYSFTTEYETSS